ncbi:MAG: hypothetical protein AB7D07_15965 [Desulfovibrionaceae bacterium]
MMADFVNLGKLEAPSAGYFNKTWIQLLFDMAKAGYVVPFYLDDNSYFPFMSTEEYVGKVLSTGLTYRTEEKLYVLPGALNDIYISRCDVENLLSIISHSIYVSGNELIEKLRLTTLDLVAFATSRVSAYHPTNMKKIAEAVSLWIPDDGFVGSKKELLRNQASTDCWFVDLDDPDPKVEQWLFLKSDFPELNQRVEIKQNNQQDVRVDGASVEEPSEGAKKSTHPDLKATEGPTTPEHAKQERPYSKTPAQILGELGPNDKAGRLWLQCAELADNGKSYKTIGETVKNTQGELLGEKQAGRYVRSGRRLLQGERKEEINKNMK